jgi:uncharacterized membrane protein YdjX (TVP38/TMEM64 family)
MIPPPSSRSSSENFPPRIPFTLIFQVGGLVLLAVGAFVIASSYPLVTWLAAGQKAVENLGFWSGLIYPLAYAVCNLLLLPGGILSVGGGFFFGLWWGFAIVLVGNLLGASIAFFVARQIGRKRIEKLVARNARWQVLDRALRRHGKKIIFLSQLNPLAPSSLLNYLYGLTGMSLKACLPWIAIGQIPGLFLYVFIGTLGQFGVQMAHGTRHLPFAHEYLVWGTGFTLTVVTTLLLGFLARRIMREIEEETSST